MKDIKGYLLAIILAIGMCAGLLVSILEELR